MLLAQAMKSRQTKEMKEKEQKLNKEKLVLEAKLAVVNANIEALQEIIRRQKTESSSTDTPETGSVAELWASSKGNRCQTKGRRQVESNEQAMQRQEAKDKLVSLGLITPFGTTVSEAMGKSTGKAGSGAVEQDSTELLANAEAADAALMRSIVSHKKAEFGGAQAKRAGLGLTLTHRSKPLQKGGAETGEPVEDTLVLSDTGSEPGSEIGVDSSSEADAADSDYVPSDVENTIVAEDMEEDAVMSEVDVEIEDGHDLYTDSVEQGEFDNEKVSDAKARKAKKDLKTKRTTDDVDDRVYWKRYKKWARARIKERRLAERLMALDEDSVEVVDGSSPLLAIENGTNVDINTQPLFPSKRASNKTKKQRRKRATDSSDTDSEDEMDEITDEMLKEEEFKPHPVEPDEVMGQFKVPGEVWSRLLVYQKVAVRWMWELHGQKAGGILGDEMGLGKTVQAIALLAGMKYSGISGRDAQVKNGMRQKRTPRLLKNVLIVCPGTIMHQWVAEFNKWWAPFRCYILHESGSFKTQGLDRAKMIEQFRRTGNVMITTYQGLKNDTQYLLPIRWDYVILDEGHKIRNPDADITIACKQLRCVHRLILSGSPLQNNLKELWSLFDFVFPGRLGPLPVFNAELAIPINLGGYANATAVQVQTSYKCCMVLRDAISPYLLRRQKVDVLSSLPKKVEQVLFCSLTPKQRTLYRQFLNGKECASIMAGRQNLLYGIGIMRKLCNHPHLAHVADIKKLEQSHYDNYGDWQLSGKMAVLRLLLIRWKEDGDRVLLFSQTRQMLDILELFVRQCGYKYCRMDGNVPVKQRQGLVKTYNEDQSIFVFLLTTKVGGLGVNLTGANRVVIYDPDWNPSTDMQARERAWRIGQERDVTVFRLLTQGAIEEKMYHRQIFKQFLANRVLKDPKQRRFFKSNDLHELFQLNEEVPDENSKSETATMFAEPGTEISRRDMSETTTDEPSDMTNGSQTTGQRDFHTQIHQDERTHREVGEEQNLAEEGRDTANESTSKVGRGPDGCDTGERSDSIPDTAKRRGEDGFGVINASDIAGVAAVETTGIENEAERKLKRDRRRKANYDTEEIDNQGDSDGVSSSKNININGKGLEDGEVAVDKISAGGMYLSKRQRVELYRKEKRERYEKAKMRGRREPMRGEESDSDGGLKNYAVGKDEDEGGILSMLFKNTGMVNGALQHDRIVDGGGQEELLVENEAKKVAKRAADALKKARSLRAHVPVHSVTWTGKTGSGPHAPKANAPNAGGGSSSSWWTQGSGKRENGLTGPHASTSTGVKVIKRRFGNVKSQALSNTARVDQAADELLGGSMSNAHSPASVHRRLASSASASANNSRTQSPMHFQMMQGNDTSANVVNTLQDNEYRSTQRIGAALGGRGAVDGSSDTGGKLSVMGTSNNFDQNGNIVDNAVNPSATEASITASSSLLNRMRQRAGLGTMDEQDATRVLVAQLRDFIGRQPNQRAATHAIVGEFELKLSKDDLGVFRSMLKEIAKFNRIDGVGGWKLKEDYM
ncbi:hypothetical protein SARC_07031 [Sphaeroforma arctica JP610]|uniref:DNA excision repair protein ERCC-6 n=1 Tax=Sphaeroforma arctica JP610 TaxID=667725 RepID=A0A0L0FXE3_9EUKA|nr:hypothetical protein SARC_07031 [Sphaeroforma arctica JP610]KNC80608.1 hypothetical protein SARC_07031 [Sphaeroforma arctica JP610]|eukprot:XP_014154510.1 hypothetical protein SARC_07031 [Sphaeroforma arctica JP610]